MAFVTGTAIGDPLTKILWSNKMHIETQAELWFNQRGMMKKEDGNEGSFERKADAPIIVKDEFGKERGQQIRLALRKQLTVLGDNTRSSALATKHYGTTTMVDAEETLNLFDMAVFVEQLKNAVAFDTPAIQDLRTNFRMDQEAAASLRDWLTANIEESLLDAAYDGNAAHVIRSLSPSATEHPNYHLAGAAAAAADFSTTGGKLDPTALRKLYADARLKNIDPIKIDGDETYVLLAHVYSTNNLDADSTFRDTNNNARQRGSDNPLFTRADSTFEGITIHEYNRIRRPTDTTSSVNTTTHENILLGANALVLGNASEPRLVERKEDKYEDIYGVGIKTIFGAARCDWDAAAGSAVFNQSSIVVQAYSVA